jgi:chromosome segregation ATPase
MKAVPILVACVLALSAGIAARADKLDASERELQNAVAERDRLAAERTRLGREAAPLVDAIARLKSESRGVRAGKDLEDHLRRFDRIAERLDEVDRRRLELDRTVARALRALDGEIDAALGRAAKAGKGGNAAAVELMARLEARRQRAHALAESPASQGFRPAIEVSVDPDDTPDEIRAKMQIAAAEDTRLQTDGARLASELALLDARIALKRRQASELEAARHEAGSAADLVQRQIDDAFRERRRLEARRDELEQERVKLDDARAHLTERTAELERRLRALGAHPPEVLTP